MLKDLLSWYKGNDIKIKKQECIINHQKMIIEKYEKQLKIEELLMRIDRNVDKSEKYTLNEDNKVDKIIKRLESYEEQIFKFRNFCLFFLFIIPLFCNITASYFDNGYFNSLTFYELSWQIKNIESDSCIIIIKSAIGILISFALTKYIHYRMAKETVKNLDMSVIEHQDSKKKIKWFWQIISPDYYYAEYYKSSLDQYKLKKVYCDCNIYYPSDKICECQMDVKRALRRSYILLCNSSNLIISSILVILSIIFGFNFAFEWLIYLIIPHLFWRSIEIFSSFYYDATNLRIRIILKDNFKIEEKRKSISVKENEEAVIVNTNQNQIDVLNEWKTSRLRKTHRIALALFSLIEIILLYSVLYYALHHLGLTGYPRTAIYFYEMILHSASLSVFNISFNPAYQWWEKILHVSQLIVSINLIVLSLASYLNLTDVLSARDKERIIKNSIN
jgi:hypothetical protein